MSAPANMSHERWYGPGELAARLNITVKALRVYERAGLVSPDRTQGGWRQYGPSHIVRLQQIIALKGIGASLKQMRDILADPRADLAAILALQEQALETQRAEVERRLAAVRAARARLAAGVAFGGDELIDLAKETAGAASYDAAEVERRLAALVEATDLARPVADLRLALEMSLADVAGGYAALETAIHQLISDAGNVVDCYDPTAPIGREIAERWLKLCGGFVDPRHSLSQHLEAFDARLEGLAGLILSEPRLAPALAFIRDAVKHARQDVCLAEVASAL